MKVFVLEHSYESEGCDEAKLIGVFSSEERAREAIDRLLGKPGFIDHPDGFTIDAYEIDHSSWESGFSRTIPD